MWQLTTLDGPFLLGDPKTKAVSVDLLVIHILIDSVSLCFQLINFLIF